MQAAGHNVTVSRGAGGIDELEASVTRMARVGGCWSPSFSPDGRRLALISDLNGVPQAWTIPVGGGWPELVTALADPVLSVSWDPSGEWLAFALAPGGGMNRQIYLIRPDGRELRRLTDGGKENNWLGPWAHDGRFLTVASNRARAGSMDMYLVDVASGRWRPVVKNEGIGYFTDVSRDGRRAVLYRMVNRSDSDLYLVDLEKETETLLTPHDGPGSFDHALFSPDGRRIIYLSNQDREMVALCRLDVDATGAIRGWEVQAGRDDAELQAFDISEDGKTAALLWNAAGQSELAFLDLESGATRAGPGLPAEIGADLTFSSGGERLALTLSGSTMPRDIYVFDSDGGPGRQVTRSARAGVDLSSLVRPRLEWFQAHDGEDLSGWLYLPEGFAGPGPMVLVFHGGPESQARPAFSSTVQALLAQGIAVFAPNVRGSAGFGKRFVNLDNGPLRFNAIRDIKSCADHVVSTGIGARGRLGIMGGSYGGYMTMAGVTEYPEMFAAAANLYGIVNFATFFEHTEPWMAEISKIQYGDPVRDRELLRELSPIHKLDRVQAATLVLHGANDTNVPVVEADQVVATLESQGVPVRYVLFPDEGHGFVKEANRIRAAVEVVRWFAEHLTGGQKSGGEK